MSESSPPVLIVGHRPGPPGAAALRYACWLASGLDASVHVVHVSEMEDYPADSDGLDWEAEAERDHVAERAAVASQLEDYPGRWSYQLAHGVPAEDLRRIAEERDAAMVIVGTGDLGAGGFVRHALGRSTVRALLRHAGRPVLVIPGAAQ